ncbi:MAG: RluA family pseudouridine synthase [Pirellulales bacterium]|nr:RluA family pseudouridine synthase [Pirellulales bacterium]
MLAVEKPAGLPTQAPAGIESLESRLRAQLAARTSYLAFPHRLDRPVSGIVLVALRKRAARLLNEQFAARKVEKVYLAEVEGQVPDTPQVWTNWLRKLPDRAEVTVCEEHDQDAKYAETHVRQAICSPARQTTLLTLSPQTGRMHQLRVQTSFRGHPIVGDRLYQAPSAWERPEADRIELHAQQLTFHDPRDGRKVTVSAPRGT